MRKWFTIGILCFVQFQAITAFADTIPKRFYSVNLATNAYANTAFISLRYGVYANFHRLDVDINYGVLDNYNNNSILSDLGICLGYAYQNIPLSRSLTLTLNGNMRLLYLDSNSPTILPRRYDFNYHPFKRVVSIFNLGFGLTKKLYKAVYLDFAIYQGLGWDYRWSRSANTSNGFHAENTNDVQLGLLYVLP